MMVFSNTSLSSLQSPQAKKKKKTSLPPGVLNILGVGDPVRNEEDSQSYQGDMDEVEISKDSNSEHK